MTDFFSGVGDWDLTAVVSGGTADNNPPHIDDHLHFSNFIFPEYLLFNDNNNYSSSNSNSNLDLYDLYKPFYPPPSPPPPPPENPPEPLPPPEKAAVGTKYRIRKNQQKRVVIEVTEDELSSDMWAWRKYGQKPIKGSPYPRSYYKCSSSKGCPARKLVERNHLDSSTFIITYTSEHNHSKPTRRNSLAGTTRQRFSSTPAPEERCTEKKMKRREKITEEIDYAGGDDDFSFLTEFDNQEHGDSSSSFW
ncbi:probable WRKY transcription factor 27 [Impatiens glandulifera]|uniref:probable WRKY transcription factor 27 n=1 Tax=Impatiens glandulifera TaxID=253017 RepID=UPI001FB12169|nr:probable WRKY transcription factor 27 [Impatiens glandulifera]